MSWLTEPGISPENRLLERSKVCNFGREQSSGGMLPEMLLFCSNLHNNKKQKPISIKLESRLKKQTKVPNFILYCCEETNKERKGVAVLHLMEISEVCDGG